MELLKKADKFISEKGFIAFLKKEVAKKAKPYKCTQTNCPLARATGFAVNQFYYTLYPELLDSCEDCPDKVIRKTPPWATSFIWCFDGTKLPKTAKTALAIMQGTDRMRQSQS